MNPDDFLSAHEGLASLAGMMWTVYTRLLAEGANPGEATALAAMFTAEFLRQSIQTTEEPK